jgi:hypothetical protein
MSFSVIHHIADLAFLTQANVSLPGLLAPPFSAFVKGAETGTPDIHNHFHKILAASEPAVPFSAAQRKALRRAATIEGGALESPLLSAAPVRDYLATALTRPPEEMHLSIQKGMLIGRDYARHVLHLFYLGEDNGQSQRHLPPAPNALGWAFHVTPVDTGLHEATPLSPEERQRLEQAVEFKQPEAFQHPLLLIEPLRSWLLACAEKGESVTVDVYLDGVVALNENQKTMTFFYRPEFYLGSAETVVGGEMRRIFASFLPDFEALLVHSSGLIYEGQAALFLAPDEGGKTTALRLAGEAQYLNDDQVILRRHEGGFFAHATPLGKLTGGPAKAPLGGLFLLKKDASFGLETIKPAEVVQALWKEYSRYAALQPRERKLAAFDLLYQACHAAPTYRLHFARRHINWQAVGAAMRAG